MLIEADDVERVLADIDAGDGDCSIEFLRHSVLLVFGAPRQRNLLAGQEHGRTIPLADLYCRPFDHLVGAGEKREGGRRGRAPPGPRPPEFACSCRPRLLFDSHGKRECKGRGSGSTLIAAHKTGRRARLIEIDPIYVDRTIRRWEDRAKDEAILAPTQQPAGLMTTGLAPLAAICPMSSIV